MKNGHRFNYRQGRQEHPVVGNSVAKGTAEKTVRRVEVHE